MTIQQLLDWFSQNQYYVLGYFALLLVLSIITVIIVNKNNIGTLKYLMSAIVYGVTVPGILAFILTLYTLLILRSSLLHVSFVAYFAPIIAMIITLTILNKKANMRQIPGFEKLSGLIIMILIAFGIVFILQKTYFGVLFIGGFAQLALVFIALLVLIRIAWAKFSN